MSKHELSKLQEAELDIFEEFIRICQKSFKILYMWRKLFGGNQA